MNGVMKIIRVLFAGLFGGFANSLGVWGFGALGISPALGFAMTPTLTMPWLMPRLVSSALWGVLFLLPFWRDSLYKKGVLLSLAPAAFMLFVAFPKMNQGMMGLKLGATAPLFVLFFTVVWGVAAAFWLKNIQKEPVG